MRLPILDWGRRYDRGTFASDGMAAVVVTIMLIPQSLAYAMLAGLPPEVGLYASVAPLIVYALLGTSSALAVGPVAVVSLMTAAALGDVARSGTPQYWQAAILLAFLSGAMLFLLGLARAGFLANFLSHPVISGFISASCLIIAASQLRHILGIPGEGHTLIEIVRSLAGGIGEVHWLTLLIGVGVTLFLFGVRRVLKPALMRLGMSAGRADGFAKAGPVVTIAITTLAVWWFGLHTRGVAIVGAIPSGLPPFTMPHWDPDLWRALLSPALLIAAVGFVESVSVGQTLAARRRERIDPDQELVALGASNVAASFTGGFPVTAGFSRSIVNFDAGARTPAAGAFAAVGLAITALFLTPLLFYLPKATLAATIIVSVLSLVDFGILRRTWRYSRADFAAVATTLLVTLVEGVEAGLIAGVAVSIGLFLFRSSRPHIAEVGLVPGTESFRNVQRHAVRTSERVLSLRVDESLYFANARFLEDRVNDAVAAHPSLEHLVLQCSAVNTIDSSALESLEAVEHRLREAGIALHLSEVKGPVMDRLAHTEFLKHLSGKVFLTHYRAIEALAPEALEDRSETRIYKPDSSARL